MCVISGEFLQTERKKYESYGYLLSKIRLKRAINISNHEKSNLILYFYLFFYWLICLTFPEPIRRISKQLFKNVQKNNIKSFHEKYAKQNLLLHKKF